MQDSRQNFETVDDSRAGSCEVGARVDEMDFAALRGGDVFETAKFSQELVVPSRTIDIVTAKSEHDDLRGGVEDLLPFDLRGWPMFAAERVVTAGDLDQFRSPMAGAKGRIDPFHEKTAWTLSDPFRSCAHRFNPSRQSPHDLLGALGHAARFPNPPDVVENIVETGRLQAHNLRRTGQSRGQSRDRAVADGANVAEFLGQDHIRPQFAQKRLVDGINGSVLAQGAFDPFIDFFAR